MNTEQDKLPKTISVTDANGKRIAGAIPIQELPLEAQRIIADEGLYAIEFRNNPATSQEVICFLYTSYHEYKLPAESYLQYLTT